MNARDRVCYSARLSCESASSTARRETVQMARHNRKIVREPAPRQRAEGATGQGPVATSRGGAAGSR